MTSAPLADERRPIAPLAAAFVLLAVTAVELHLYLHDGLPRIAPALSAAGATFWLPIRFTIAAGQWWVVIGAVGAAALAHLGFFWRRGTPTGGHVVLALAVAFALFVQTVFLLTVFQAAAYLPPPS
jgi:hypothetical protein